jgi:hypothetical protein
MMPAEFVCKGCGRHIEKGDASLGHSETCPFWGSIENARIDRNSLHELLRMGTPPGADPEHYRTLRAAAYDFANAILATTPASQGQQIALRRLRDSLVTATASMPSQVHEAPPPAPPAKPRKTRKK